MEETQAILKLRKERKAGRAIAKALDIAIKAFSNALKETTGVLKIRYQTGWPNKTAVAYKQPPEGRNLEVISQNADNTSAVKIIQNLYPSPKI